MDKTEQADLTPYYYDKRVRKLVDTLLQKNAVIQSNLGIDSTKQEKNEGHRKAKEISKQIKLLDEVFAKSAFPEYIKQ